MKAIAIVKERIQEEIKGYRKAKVLLAERKEIIRKDEEMFEILSQLPEEAGYIIVGKYDAAVEALGEDGIKRIIKVASDDELLWPLRLMFRKRKVEVNFDTLSKLFTSLRKSNLIRAEINLCSGFEDYIYSMVKEVAIEYGILF